MDYIYICVTQEGSILESTAEMRYPPVLKDVNQWFQHHPFPEWIQVK